MKVTARTADLPLSLRRKQEAAAYEQLMRGLTERHVQNAAEREAIATHNIARALDACSALQPALRGGKG